MKNQKHLKVARVMAGYTQAQLAKAIGTTQSSISAWENGGLGEARLKDVLKLCKLFGCNLDDLIKEV